MANQTGNKGATIYNGLDPQIAKELAELKRQIEILKKELKELKAKVG